MVNEAVPVLKKRIENNSWIHESGSRTVVIFIHGIFSDSHGCWRNSRYSTYWPNLVASDPDFNDPAVFVSGYTSDAAAGSYDVRAAADDVIAFLRCPGGSKPAPLSKDRILFVCHSQGGIVVRQMLCSYFKEFESKQVGIVLCGSPGWGSMYATIFAPVARLFRSEQGKALRWGAATLRNLDRDFLDLLRDRRIPNLTGVSLAETRGRFLGFPIWKIVSEPSATRYFTGWYQVPKTTHSSLVKPDSTNHISHVRLRDFALQNGFLTKAAFMLSLKDLLQKMAALIEAYDPRKPLDLGHKTKTLSEMFRSIREVLSRADREDRFAHIPLSKLLSETLDAGPDWPLFQTQRTEFMEMHNALGQLLIRCSDHA